MNLSKLAKRVFCLILGTAFLISGWAAFSPVSAEEAGCDIFCISSPECPEGTFFNISCTCSGSGLFCCLGGCGGGCLTAAECAASSIGPVFCAFCPF